MMECTLMQAAKSMHGELHGVDSGFRGVSTDTRTLREGELFFALHGPNFDGQEFVAAAATKQAAAAVVQQVVDAELANITVDDTRVALGELAANWRRQMPARVLAITGSNGKTTVKEMVASCLSLCGATLATDGNLNNDIGVPLMLLRLAREHEYGVFELGANHPDEIAFLAGLASPHVVLITNAAAAHLEGFGSIAGVAKAKGEILQGAPAPECAILNRDDEYFELWKSMAGDIPVRSFGLSSQADVFATDIKPASNGSEFTLTLPQATLHIALPLAGEHNVLNACAAASALLALGVAPQLIKKGLENVQPVSGRLRAVSSVAGINLFDDSYNANPASVIAAAEFLAAQAGAGWLVLGDMGELGADSALLHESVGQAASRAGIDRIFATGKHSRRTVAAFGAAAEWFETTDDLSAAVLAELDAHDADQSAVNILVKGSRSMRMERVVASLIQQFEEAGA